MGKLGRLLVAGQPKTGSSVWTDVAKELMTFAATRWHSRSVDHPGHGQGEKVLFDRRRSREPEAEIG